MNKVLPYGVIKNFVKYNGKWINQIHKINLKFSKSFTHRGVNYIDFSPNERYLITFSSRPNNPEAFIIWDVIKGERKRSFPFEQYNSQGPSYFK
jgi:uncharacterized protein with WD repeat